MRRLIKLEADLRDLVLIKKALEVSLGDEVREKRLADILGLIAEIDRIIRVEYAVSGFFNLVIDTKQARILDKLVPNILYGMHHQLDEALHQ